MEEPTGLRYGYVVAAFGRFCEAEGLGAGRVGHGLVEAFVTLGLPGRAPSTKGTYRSVLRHDVAAKAPRQAPGFAPSPAARPYSAQELAELFSVAASQKSTWWRSSALSFLALCTGAGLRPAELVSVTGAHVSTRGGALAVTAGDGRVVPAGGTCAEVLARQADRAGTGYLFCPGDAKRSYKNFVNNFCYKLTAGPSAPRFSSGRARSTFICSHLAAGTPLGELLYIAGISEVEPLLRYCRHVPGAPGSKAELGRRLRQG
jgi:integrase